MRKGAGKKVLITGGSSGIGLELAKCFAADGYEVLLVASNEDKLSKAKAILEAYQIPVYTYVVNLAEQGAAKQLYQAVRKDGHRIDVLVNNAGIGTIGATEQISIEEDDGKLVWTCPQCGNQDQSKMNVARRTCGYIGTQFWNQGRTQEIKDRVLHL